MIVVADAVVGRGGNSTLRLGAGTVAGRRQSVRLCSGEQEERRRHCCRERSLEGRSL